MITPGAESNKVRVARRLAVVLYLVAAVLTIKTGFDLIEYRHRFPSFFVPAFVVLTAALVAWAGYVTFQVRGLRDEAGTDWLEGPAVWILLAASFVCTTGVHGFYPFRPAPLGGYLFLLDFSEYPVWTVNTVLALGGFIATIVLRRAYRSGHRGTALLGLAVIGCLLVLPNDNCKNPFNDWWLRTLGASPLMYVPNMYAAIFGMAALQGIQPRANVRMLAAICVATASLALGHMTRLIW